MSLEQVGVLVCQIEDPEVETRQGVLGEEKAIGLMPQLAVMTPAGELGQV